MLANKEVIIQRAKICKECEHLTPIVNICKRCGCFVNAKATLADAACPIGKWSRVIPIIKIKDQD